MSSRRVTPPQNTTFGAAPFETVVEQRDERLDVAADRGGVTAANKFYFYVRHVHLHCSNPILHPFSGRRPRLRRRGVALTG